MSEDLIERLRSRRMGIHCNLPDDDCEDAADEIEKLRSQLASAKAALVKIEQSDRVWCSDYAKDPKDILDRSVTGNVLVHGYDGRIAFHALSALTDETGKV